MQRIPEPELMEEDEQARAYAEADFDEPHSHFIELLVEHTRGLPESGLALDLGCGPADITLRFARRFVGWSVHGVDGSPAMLRYGAEAVRAAGLGGRVRLVQARLPEQVPPAERYDLVLSNSLLHHLPDPSILWDAVRRWASPGAAVFVMDLLRPASREAAGALVEEYTAGEPELLRHDFFHSLMAAYSPSEVRDQLRQAGLDPLELHSVSDRHWIAYGRC